MKPVHSALKLSGELWSCYERLGTMAAEGIAAIVAPRLRHGLVYRVRFPPGGTRLANPSGKGKRREVNHDQSGGIVHMGGPLPRRTRR